MKKFILFSLLVTTILLATSCSSHTTVSEDKVPAAVVTSFKGKYPAAVLSKWITENKDGKTIYEAVFKTNGEEVEAEFNEDGSFIKEH